MLLWVLGIFDIFAGVMLALCEVVPYAGNGIIGTIGALLIIKGVWSVIVAAANNFFFDVIGLIDVTAGILLLATTLGFFMHFFIYLGIALALKGFYSIVAGIISAGK